MPYAYGLDALASTNLAETSTVGKTPELNTKNTNAVDYITKWNHMQDAEFLSELLKQDIKICFTEKPLTIKSPEQSFDRRALIIIKHQQLITGTIIKAGVDNTHPLAFGYDKNYFSLKSGSNGYSLLDNGYNVASLGENPKKVSGFTGENTLKPLKTL